MELDSLKIRKMKKPRFREAAGKSAAKFTWAHQLTVTKQ
jgi:hypothetical protein